MWQGDVFEGVPWGYVRELTWLTPDSQRIYRPADEPALTGKGYFPLKGGRNMAALITHECVFDKRHTAPLTFARLFRLREQTERIREQIVAGSWPAAFHLPADDSRLDEDMFVDFRMILAIDSNVATTFKKRLSLTPDGRQALREQLTRFWTRTDLLA
jgi:hypothetical protein